MSVFRCVRKSMCIFWTGAYDNTTLYFCVLKSIYVRNLNSIFQTLKDTHKRFPFLSSILSHEFDIRHAYGIILKERKLSKIHLFLLCAFLFPYFFCYFGTLCVKNIRTQNEEPKWKIEIDKNILEIKKKKTCIMYAKWLLWSKRNRQKWWVLFAIE